MSEELLERSASDWSTYSPGNHKDIKKIIRDNINSVCANYVAIGYYLNVVNDKGLYKDDGYSGIGEYAAAEYGITKDKCSFLTKIAKKFCIPNSPALLPEYKDFKVEKLRAMLYLSDEQVEQVTIATTRAEIREMRKPSPETVEPAQLKPELSAYGTLKTVRPDGSLLTTPGCEGGHDCFCCAMDCSIRDEDRYCVEAPMGDPFYCDTMYIDDGLLGIGCMFVNLELAYHRAGDKEPVPCCKECLNKCEYACKRAKSEVKQDSTKTEREPIDFTRSIDSMAKEFEATGSCPPDQGSCRRNGEEGEEGKKICTGCWRDWLTLEKLRAASVNEEAEPLDDSPTQKEEKSLPETHDESWFVKQYFDRSPDSLAKLMRMCRESKSRGEVAKEFQQFKARYGHSFSSGLGYCFTFMAFTSGIDLEVEREKIHLKYGRLVEETLKIYNPFDSTYDEPKVKDIVSESTESIIEEESQKAPFETVEAEIIQTVPEDPEVEDYERYTFQDVRDEYDKLDEYVTHYRRNNDTMPGRRKAKMRLDAIILLRENMQKPKKAELIEPAQPELPILKNNDQRKEWIENYSSWPVWIDLEQTGERYYRYDFVSGVSFVIRVSLSHEFLGWQNGGGYSKTKMVYDHEEYFLLGGVSGKYEPENKSFYESKTNMSSMVEYLKDLQKK